MCVCVRACVGVGGCFNCQKVQFPNGTNAHIYTKLGAHFTGMLTIHMYYTVPVTYEALQLA